MFFDGNSSGTVTIATSSCLNFDATGFTGTINHNGATLTCHGNFNIGSTATTTSASTGFITFAGNVTHDISGSVIFRCRLNLGSGSPDILDLRSNIDTGANFRSVINTNTRLNLNGFSFSAISISFGTGTTLDLTNSTLTLVSNNASFTTDFGGPATLTTTGSTINHTGTVNFIGGNRTFNDVWFQANCTVLGSNTFADLKISASRTVSFTTGTTQTITSLTSLGTVGNLAVIRSTTAVAFTLSKASGTVTPSYLSITDSTATGGATWDASNGTNTNGGGNTGWIFSAASGFFFLT